MGNSNAALLPMLMVAVILIDHRLEQGAAKWPNIMDTLFETGLFYMSMALLKSLELACNFVQHPRKNWDQKESVNFWCRTRDKKLSSG